VKLHPPINSAPLFEACYYINLDRSPERNERFLRAVAAVKDWPFKPPIRWAGVDVEPPSWHRAGRGGWGCLLSHIEILTHCLIHGVRSVMIFEDDAVFCDGFGSRAREFYANVPDDWNQIYFGGNHYALPEVVDENVLLARICNTTHAYAIQGSAMSILHQALATFPNCLQDENCHVDAIYGSFHQLRKLKAYTPWKFLVGQAAIVSERTGRQSWDEDLYFDLHDSVRERLKQCLAKRQSRQLETVR